MRLSYALPPPIEHNKYTIEDATRGNLRRRRKFYRIRDDWKRELSRRANFSQVAIRNYCSSIEEGRKIKKCLKYARKYDSIRRAKTSVFSLNQTSRTKLHNNWYVGVISRDERVFLVHLAHKMTPYAYIDTIFTHNFVTTSLQARFFFLFFFLVRVLRTNFHHESKIMKE